MIFLSILLSLSLTHATPAEPSKSSETTVGFFPTNIFSTLPEESLTYFNVVFLNQVGQSLVSEDRAGAIIPSIAKSWTISPDRTVYKFILRDDIHFHDGTPLTAEDVAQSFNGAIYSESSAASKYLTVVKGYQSGLASKKCAGVRAVSKYEFELQLSRPYTPLMRLLASGALPIQKSQRVGRKFIGTGPYKIDEDKNGPILSSYAEYKGPYVPHIKTIRLIANDSFLVPSAPIPRDQLPDFDIAIMNDIRLNSYPASEYEIVRFPGAMVKAFYLHPSKSGNLTDKAVRLKILNLLQHALEKLPFDERLNLKLTDIYPLGMLGHVDKRASYLNFEKAMKLPPRLLKQPIRMAHIGPVSPFIKSVAEVLERDFKQPVRLVPIDYGKINESLKDGDFDVVAMSFKGILLDPDTSFTPFDLVKASELSSRNSEFLRLREAGSSAVLNKERIDFYGKLADLIFDEGLFLPISQAIEHQAINKKLKYKRVTYKYTPNFSDLE